MTVTGRRITIAGVKPLGLEQRKYDYLWLYGLVEPASGESFFLEFSHLDGICFEKYLSVFSETFPDDLHIIQLDNGGLHRRLDLEIPQNIILLFQPPYCPELNPIERLWQHLKSQLRWRNFKDLEELRQKLREILNSLTTEVIASVTGWQFILEALSVAGI